MKGKSAIELSAQIRLAGGRLLSDGVFDLSIPFILRRSRRNAYKRVRHALLDAAISQQAFVLADELADSRHLRQVESGVWQLGPECTSDHLSSFVLCYGSWAVVSGAGDPRKLKGLPMLALEPSECRRTIADAGFWLGILAWEDALEWRITLRPAA